VRKNPASSFRLAGVFNCRSLRLVRAVVAHDPALRQSGLELFEAPAGMPIVSTPDVRIDSGETAV